jgi:DNA-binding CsgD family transcriptional regulator
VLYRLAHAEAIAGHPADALRLASEGLELARATGSPTGEATNCGPLALAQAMLGNVREARATVTLGVDLDDPWYETPNRWIQGFIELTAGSIDEALRAYARGDELIERVGVRGPSPWYPRSDLAEASILVGDQAAAEALLDRLGGLWSKAAGTWWRGSLHRARGLLCAARGDLVSAEAELESALRIGEAHELRIELGRTCLALGSVQRRAKRKAAAHASLLRAASVFEAMPAPLWAAKARDELARLGLARADRFELTEAERRVAEMVASGHSNREVARELFMAVRTVEAHLSRTYRKLGIRGRTQLARALLAADEGPAEA